MHLPENAFRELKPGERYEPIVPASEAAPEITARSIVFGLLMTALFSAAAAYISLKLGQGIESAIPIAILAIGLSAVARRKSGLLENVNIVVLGSTAGIIVGGSTFTMPAIFVLGLEAKSSFAQIFVVPLLGAILGVLFLIPFRRYFVAEMHGKLPFPEATATAEILVTGARGGKQAFVLLYSMGLGMCLDFLAVHFKAWRDTFTTTLTPSLDWFTEKARAIFVLNTSAAVMGLGYIVGIKYASIIAAGSFVSYYVFIPLFGYFAPHVSPDAFPGRPPLLGLGAEDLFYDYVRYIGIGAIFAAGVISVGKMSPVIVQAVRRVFGELGKSKASGPAAPRTEQDVPMPWIFAGVAVIAVLLFLYFRFVVLSGAEDPTTKAVAALGLSVGISFLFAAVSAWAIAVVGTTPISGMTLTTLILSAVALSAMGLKGPDGQLAVLLIGGVVCSALSMTGSMVTMLKVGYWTGATPKRIQWTLIAGSIVAAVTVTGVMFVLNDASGFVKSAAHPEPLVAPQANAMAAVLGSVMSDGGAPWFLYAIGAVISVAIEMVGVSSLAFALGMYLPIDLNTPILAGGIVSWLVARPSGNSVLDRARINRGTLIASGFIAGGALAGVLDGFIKFGNEGRPLGSIGNDGWGGNLLGLAVFLSIGVFLWWDARKATEAEGAGPQISL